MNIPAQILFETMRSEIASWSKHVASEIRRAVPTDNWAPEHHETLEVALRDGMRSLAWSFLGTFDNVGCVLPDGVLGYRITALPCVESNESDVVKELDPVEIREGEADYADMWQEFLMRKGKLT